MASFFRSVPDHARGALISPAQAALTNVLREIICCPFLPCNAVHKGSLAHDFNGANQALAQAQGHSNRRGVVRVDQADDLWLFHFGKRKLKSLARPFGGIPTTPEGSAQRPTDFKSRPAIGIPEANVADQVSRRLFDRGPKP